MADRLFRALANEHRRRLLVSLLEHNPQDGVAVTDDRWATVESVARHSEAMIHHHLPMLEDAGYIRWNRDTNEVARGPQFEALVPFLEFIRDHPEALPNKSTR